MKCSHCDKTGASYACSACKATWYCGEKCQQADLHIHDLFCWTNPGAVSPMSHEKCQHGSADGRKVTFSKTNDDDPASTSMPLKGCLKKRHSTHVGSRLSIQNDSDRANDANKHVRYGIEDDGTISVEVIRSVTTERA
mmetsp:Transcript_2353/g.4455  ORF Transcript_2353/g.4455 Transcript_2353/m.4455 type:complete len:138 (-) Transcript_2353:310-723(-)